MKSWCFPLYTRNKTAFFHRIIISILIVSTIFTIVWTDESSAKARKHPRLSLIGAPSAISNQTVKNLEDQGFRVSVNQLPNSTDMVLFVVSAKDGPMPQTRQEISRYKGMQLPLSAILLVDIDASTDQELTELVVLEMRELLSLYVMTGEDSKKVEALRADDPNLSNKIRNLL